MTLRSWFTDAKSKFPVTLHAAFFDGIRYPAHELGEPESGAAVALCAQANPQKTTQSKVKSLISKSLKMLLAALSK